jgi:hypothetical protein
MAGFLHHRYNGIAALVVIAVIITVVLMYVMPAETHKQRTIYTAIVCVFWLIPSSLYYALIYNYKKTIRTEIVPKIAMSSAVAMQHMMDGKTYSKEQKDEILAAIVRTAVDTTASENKQTQGDDMASALNLPADNETMLEAIAKSHVRDELHK